MCRRTRDASFLGSVHFGISKYSTLRRDAYKNFLKLFGDEVARKQKHKKMEEEEEKYYPHELVFLEKVHCLERYCGDNRDNECQLQIGFDELSENNIAHKTPKCSVENFVRKIS